MLAKSLFKVLESRVASVGHWRPELLAVRGRPFLELLYGGCRETRSLCSDLCVQIWTGTINSINKLFASKFTWYYFKIFLKKSTALWRKMYSEFRGYCAKFHEEGSILP